MIDFDETSEAYHAHAAIGSGDIRNMLRSPALFIDGIRGLCDRQTKALIFGVASHTRLLEPGAFATRVAVQPPGHGKNTTIGKAWHARYAVGKMVISESDAVHLSYMEQRMPDEVREIFARCRKEVTVRTMIGDIEVQARPDLWDIEGARKYDLKGIDCIDNIDKAIWSRRYDVQDRWYDRLIEKETGRRVAVSEIIFAEKAPPYRWRVRELDPDYRAIADRDINAALEQIRARRLSGCWDDPDGLRDIASPPRWMEDDIPTADELETEDAL